MTDSPALISSVLTDNETWLRVNILANCQDVKTLSMSWTVDQAVKQSLFLYLEGTTDMKQLGLTFFRELEPLLNRTSENTLVESMNQLHVPEVTHHELWEPVIASLFRGAGIFFLDGLAGALVIKQSAKPLRSPEEPATEMTIRGAHDGFGEDVTQNLALLRMRLPTPQLACEFFEVGSITKTRVALLFLRDVVDRELISTIRIRLNAIQVEELTESAHLEELLEDHKFTLFPHWDYTERPAKLAAILTEGRIGILQDTSSTALIAPVSLMQWLQAPDDYNDRFPFAAFARTLRMMGMLISLFLPAIYVAATEFHQDTIPVFLLITLVNSHKGVPFSTPLEAFIMLGLFELFREAGLRLPRSAGQTIGLLGTVVVGDAAVKAGIASSGMITVVGITAISAYVVPNYTLSNALPIVRMIMLILASFMGYVGLIIGGILLIGHWASLNSYGASYLAPYSPFIWNDWKDYIIRVKWTRMRKKKAPRAGFDGSSSGSSS